MAHAADMVRVMRTARMWGTESLMMARKEMASSQNWSEIQVISSRRRF
jgi:hypothetical protein